MTTYLLVHGGFTDSAYRGETAALLKEEGGRVLLAELPSTGTDPSALGGLAEDATEVRRLLDEADGPTVLVAHSYGGMVITEVGDHPAIEHTVYVSAAWPERGQTMLDVVAGIPTLDCIVPTEDGSAMQVTRDVEVAHEALCAGLDPARVPQWHADLMLFLVRERGHPEQRPRPRAPRHFRRARPGPVDPAGPAGVHGAAGRPRRAPVDQSLPAAQRPRSPGRRALTRGGHACQKMTWMALLS